MNIPSLTNSVVERLTRDPIPKNRRFALVGNTDSSNVFDTVALHDCAHTRSDTVDTLERIVFSPSAIILEKIDSKKKIKEHTPKVIRLKFSKIYNLFISSHNR